MSCITSYTFLVTALAAAACVNSTSIQPPGDHLIHTSTTISPVVNEDKSSVSPRTENFSGHSDRVSQVHHTQPILQSIAHEMTNGHSRLHLPMPQNEDVVTVHRSDNTFPSSFAGQLTSLLTSASSPLSRLRSPFIMTLPDTFLSDFSAPSPFHAPLASPFHSSLTSPTSNAVDIMPLHKCKYCSNPAERPFNAPFRGPMVHKYNSRPSYLPPSPAMAARPQLYQPRPSPNHSHSKMNSASMRGKINSIQQQQYRQKDNEFSVKGNSQASASKYPTYTTDHSAKASPIASSGKQLVSLKDSSRIVVLVVHLDKSDDGNYSRRRPIDTIKGSFNKAIGQMREPVIQQQRQLHELDDALLHQRKTLYNQGQIKQAASPTVTNNVYFDPERIQLPYFTGSLVSSAGDASPSPPISSTDDAAAAAVAASPPLPSANIFPSANRMVRQNGDRNSNDVRTAVTSTSFIPSPREEDASGFKPMTLLGHRMRSTPSASASVSSDVISHSIDDVQRKVEDYASPISLSSSLSPSFTASTLLNSSSKVPVSSMSLSFKSAISSLQPSSQPASPSARRPPQRSS